MWTLIKCAKEGDVWSAHKEFLLDSDSEISTEPTNHQPIAPGSIAYTHGLAKIWMKNADNTWSLIPDGGGASNVDDVQINGTSIVSNKIANIPLMANGVTGVAAVSTPDGSGIEIVDGQLKAIHATNSQITNRNNSRRHISPQNMDFAVKSAMCDGTGTAWTEEEKTAAKSRLGINEGFKKTDEFTITAEQAALQTIYLDLSVSPVNEMIVLMQSQNGVGNNNYVRLYNGTTQLHAAFYYNATNAISLLHWTALDDDFISFWSKGTTNTYTTDVKGSVSVGNLKNANRIALTRNGSESTIGEGTIVTVFIK